MRIPCELKVGAIIYTVRFCKLKSAAETLREANLIKINDKLTKKHQEQAFIHELVHCINWEMKEKETELLSQMLYQVLTENHLLKE